MYKIGDKIHTTVAGSLQKDVLFKIVAIDKVKWIDEEITEFTLTDGFTTFQAFEDTCY